MADLASLGFRQDTIRKLTNNRSSVLPNRRDTRIPELAVRADMRTAARGDGGAEELRQVLSGFMSAGARAFDAQTQARKPLYEQQRAEGVMAASSGTALPDDAPTAYEEAYYGVQAESHFNAFATQVKADVEAAINAGEGPDEIQTLYAERVAAFVQDFRDVTPNVSAFRATAGRIKTLTSALETDLGSRIAERMKENLVATQDANIAGFLRSWPPPSGTAGDPAAAPGNTTASEPPPLPSSIPVEAWIRTFRDGGLSPSDAKSKVAAAVMAVALDRDQPRPELLEALLDSTQDDGKTPSLNSAEQLQVQDRLAQARNLLEQRRGQQREDRRDALMDAWLPRVLDGEMVDDEIIQAGRDGVLEPQEIIQYQNLAENLRNAPHEGHEDTDFVLDLTRRAAMGNPPSNAEVLRWASTGRFGTGRAAQRAAIRFLQDTTASRGGAGGGSSIGMSARTEATRNITTARGFLWEETQPSASRAEWSQYQREMMVLQDREFNRRVRSGEDAFAVARDLATRNRDVISRNRRPAAPNLPTGNQAVAPGSYTWSPS